jgi:hypothetical protein
MSDPHPHHDSWGIVLDCDCAHPEISGAHAAKDATQADLIAELTRQRDDARRIAIEAGAFL